MTDDDALPSLRRTQEPVSASRTAQPARTGQRSVQVTPRVRAAVEAMVWQALTRKEAAEVAGLTEHALYCALRKPHVMAHYLSLCEVLRLSGRARRIHRLEAMVEQDENKAAVVNASIALDRPSESAMQSSASQAVPGITIHIHETPASPPPAKIIDATPSARVPAIDRQGD